MEMQAELGQHVKWASSHIGAGHTGLVSGHWAESAGRAEASLATFPNVLGHIATIQINIGSKYSSAGMHKHNWVLHNNVTT